ncbi:MAG: Rieske 2Fe-2S domain-containing protein [Bacteroidota bacterium]
MPADKIIEVSLPGRQVCLLKKNDTVHAFAASCPHAGVALCFGWLDAQGRVVCPEHKYRFDPATGRNTSGEGYKLFTYPAEVRHDEIFVATPPSV